MKTIALLFWNSLWFSINLGKYMAFAFGSRFVSIKQADILQSIIRRNRDSRIGISYGFADIETVGEFQSEVPISSYEDYEGYIERMKEGEENVLFSERLSMFAPTSGSTAGSKFIPYNRSFVKEFRAGIGPWIASLYLRSWRVLQGSSYWSISPLGHEKWYTGGGIPVGFNDDSEYFGLLERMIIGRLLSVPKELCMEKDIDNYRYLSSYFLLLDKNLAFVSVWNPTFFSILLKYMEKNFASLLEDIGLGKLSVPNGENFSSYPLICSRIKADPERAGELAEIGASGKRLDFRAVWPRLHLLSCWCDGNSAEYAKELAEMLPGIEIQPKGLVLTEAFVSQPLSKKYGSCLSYRTHFFEFIDREGLVHLADGLSVGGTYTVVVTSGNGFYRYRTGDLVEVTGYYHDCPCLRFVGRENNISDLFGEKLDEMHVSRSIAKVFEEFKVEPAFFMLAPEKEQGCFYVLYIEAELCGGQWAKLRESLEQKLCENYHYAYCLKLGQLQALRIFRIREEAAKQYIDICCRHGQRLGDIKQQALHKKSGWSESFRGSYV